MNQEELILLWKKGISKRSLAIRYQREYNQNMKVIRSCVRHRHDGKMVSYLDSLFFVEKTIYDHVMQQKEK